jgi:hypothetical protein
VDKKAMSEREMSTMIIKKYLKGIALFGFRLQKKFLKELALSKNEKLVMARGSVKIPQKENFP